MTIPFYDAHQVETYLDIPGCTATMRWAMTALSTRENEQPLRQIIRLDEGAAFGLMSGELRASSTFGAKLISVFRDPETPGRARHRGIVAAFDLQTGELSCLADAEAITTLRTACASAAATDALARANARVLAIFGTGTQAVSHLRAVSRVRGFAELLVWGRDVARSQAFAAEMTAELGRPVTAVADPAETAGRADVICTVTGSREPILFGRWLSPGCHVNLVGSSGLGPVEADTDLVARARFIVDYRPGVLAQGSELAAARAAGVVDDNHVRAEIGAILAGEAVGRENDEQITVYKSLGHVVQDLAAARYVHARATAQDAPGESPA